MKRQKGLMTKASNEFVPFLGILSGYFSSLACQKQTGNNSNTLTVNRFLIIRVSVPILAKNGLG
jgi:hypothetical protein